MLHVARRESPASRFFPPLRANPYKAKAEVTSAPSARHAAEQILALGRRPRTFGLRLGWWLRPDNAAARLLYLHQLALTEEQKGRAGRADFWWAEFTAQMQRIPAGDPAWAHLTACLGKNAALGRPEPQNVADKSATVPGEDPQRVAERADPHALRGRIFRELILDADLALFNGLAGVSSPASQSRRAAHQARINTLLKDATFSAAERADLLAQIEWRAVEELAAARTWAAVPEGVRRYLAALPDQAEADRRLTGLFAPVSDGPDTDAILSAADQVRQDHPKQMHHAARAARLYRWAIDRALERQQWERVLALAERRRSAFPKQPEYRRSLDRFRLRAIRVFVSAARGDQKSWGSADRIALRLTQEYPERTDYRHLLLNIRRRAARRLEEDTRSAPFAAFGSVPDWSPVVQAALGAASLSEDERDLSFARHVWRRALADLKQRNAQAAAVEITRLCVKSIPMDHTYCDACVEQLLDQGLGEASKQTGAGKEYEARQAAEKLREVIAELEKVLADAPHAYPAFDAIALLAHARAVKLANGDRPGSALLVIAQAIAYRPDWEDARSTEGQIEKLHADFQSQLDKLNIPRAPSHLLSAYSTLRFLKPDVYELVSDVSKGIKERNDYRRGHAPLIAAQRKRAKALHFWLRVGLPIPEADWDRKANDLDVATDMLMEQKPADGMDLIGKWHDICQEHRDLRVADVDVLKLLAFFGRRPNTNDEVIPEEKEPEIEEMPTFPEESQEEEADPLAHSLAPDAGKSTEQIAPLLPPAPVSGKSVEAVPFDFWLFSRCAIPAKLVAAGALAALVAAALMTLYDSSQAKQRDQAYADILESRNRRDYVAGEQAIERFRQARTLALGDARVKFVDQCDREFTELKNLFIRDAAIADLKIAEEHHDLQAASAAGQRFRDALPAQAKDSRSEFVDRLSREMPEWPKRRLRDAAYARFHQGILRYEKEDSVLDILQGAEAFLEALSPTNRDAREAEVRTWYDLAYGSWVRRQGDLRSDEPARQVEKYRRLASASNLRKDVQP